MTETARLLRNQKTVLECHPAFARKMKAIQRDLEGHGYRIRFQQGWRSLAEQARYKSAGTSTLSFGWHNLTTAKGARCGLDGVPDACAVDCLDDDRPLNSSVRFYLMLASSAAAHGCETGILWGVKDTKMRKRIQDAIKNRDWDARGLQIGWDPGHVQPKGLTLWAARYLGLRPR